MHVWMYVLNVSQQFTLISSHIPVATFNWAFVRLQYQEPLHFSSGNDKNKPQDSRS